MSNNLNQVETEAKEVYDSIEKIQAALADGKITADEAGTLLQSVNNLSTDLPELAQEGKELIENVEKEVEADIAQVQSGKIYKALSALRADPSMANFAKLLYAIVEHFLPSEPATNTEASTTDTNVVADSSKDVTAQDSDTLVVDNATIITDTNVI